MINLPFTYFETHHPATNRLTAKSLKFYEENGSSTVNKRLQYIFERWEVNGSGSPAKQSWAWMSWNSALEASDLPCRQGGCDWKQSLYGRFVYVKVLHPPALTATIKQAEKVGGHWLLPNILPEKTEEKTKHKLGMLFLKMRDFPGGPVVKTPRFHCRGCGSIPGWGTNILHTASRRGQKNFFLN